ncbi:MAG: pilus assembly protein [Archangiaceae bacterium]|nr:pilus assembly protein [Archangiaceae bacterium]
MRAAACPPGHAAATPVAPRPRLDPGSSSTLRGAAGRRGQATVELALGALVLVTVIIFGIHFAEVGYLSLKVQEAATFAAWEATGRRVQDLGAGTDAPFDAIVGGPSAVGPLARAAYRDFNGLSSVDTGADQVVKGLTRGQGLAVTCTRNDALSFRPTTTASKVYFDTGGISCRAEARLSAAHFPTRFLDQADGFFKAQQYDARGAAQGGAMKVCSMGRAVGGSCGGSMSLLLNDWGLAGDAEKAECRLTVGNPGGCDSSTGGSPAPPPNTVYKEAVRRMWSPSFSGAVTFAMQYAGAAPARPNEFWFSYAGLESGYLTQNGGEGRGEWHTGGPGVATSTVPDLEVAKSCFLGMPGRPGQGCP